MSGPISEEESSPEGVREPFVTPILSGTEEIPLATLRTRGEGVGGQRGQLLTYSHHPSRSVSMPPKALRPQGKGGRKASARPDPRKGQSASSLQFCVSRVVCQQLFFQALVLRVYAWEKGGSTASFRTSRPGEALSLVVAPVAFPSRDSKPRLELQEAEGDDLSNTGGPPRPQKQPVSSRIPVFSFSSPPSPSHTHTPSRSSFSSLLLSFCFSKAHFPVSGLGPLCLYQDVRIQDEV